MRVYCTGADSPHENKQTTPPNIVLYDYQNSRRGQCVKDYPVLRALLVYFNCKKLNLSQSGSIIFYS